MKKIAMIALGSACMAAGSYADWLDEGQQSVRLDYIYADDVGSESLDGVEIAVGTALYDLDDVAVFYMYAENDDANEQRLGISVQQHFPIPQERFPLIPYLGAGVGYAWQDLPGSGESGDDIDKGGFLARVEGGALLKFCDYFALSAGARLNYSNHDIFLDNDSVTQDTEWDFNFGARFYY